MTPEQEAYLRTQLKGRQVDDIGCGPCQRLKFLGDSIDYLGIDKEYFENTNTIQWNLSKPCPRLRHDTAFVAWPPNRRSIAWHLFLREYHEVFYLGVNHMGICCGDPDLWKMLSRREVIHIIPSPHETLIHYGKNPRPAGAMTPQEEANGIGVWEGKEPAIYNESPYLE